MSASAEAPIRPDPAGLAGLAGPAPASAVPVPPRRWKSRVLLPGLLAAGFLALFLPTLRDLIGGSIPVRVVPVVAKASAGGGAAGEVVARAAGWVEPDPFPVQVPALTDGIVAEVLVLEGEAVEEGQVIARLVPDDARLALARAEAELRSREAALAAARTDWENPVERERETAAADALARESRAAATAAAADAIAQRTVVDELEEQLRREKATAASGATPGFDPIRTAHRLAGARAQCDALAARSEAAAARADEFAANLKAAREAARLRVAERRALDGAAAEADRARAMRDEARLAVDRLEVRAPIAGAVQRRLVSPGARVMRAMDDPLAPSVAILYDPARLQVRVDVPLADAARASVGQEARVQVEVLPGRSFAGTVTRVTHEADLQKNTLQVKVAIRDPDASLKPEMLARVELLAPAGGGGASASALRVFAPERALVRGAGGDAAAWVADAGRGRAERRALRLGTAREDGWIEVLDGLRPGDLVVEDAPAGLEPGARVRVVAGGGR